MKSPFPYFGGKSKAAELIRIIKDKHTPILASQAAIAKLLATEVEE